MKFIVSSSQLLKNIQKISGVISSNTVLPILEDFLFDIKKGRLTIFATDLETSMSSEMDVECKEDFSIAIPAKILSDIVKTLPEQPITISIDPVSFGIEITSDNGKYKLAGENGEDFPKVPLKDDVQAINIPAKVLSGSINKTLFAVSADELRPAMTGVLFQLRNNAITFVATDAHKLVKYERSDIVNDEERSFIVPKKAMTLLKGALPNGDQDVAIAYNNSNAFFEFENIKLICRLIDAKYPDYNAVIPVDNPHLLTINKDDLQSSLRRISIFANKTTYQVILKITGSELLVSAQDLDFSNEASERLVCEYQGEDLEIGFNAKFLLDMLNTLDGDEIKLELSTPTRAGILKPSEIEGNESLLMLVMPVMLNN